MSTYHSNVTLILTFLPGSPRVTIPAFSQNFGCHFLSLHVPFDEPKLCQAEL